MLPLPAGGLGVHNGTSCSDFFSNIHSNTVEDTCTVKAVCTRGFTCSVDDTCTVEIEIILYRIHVL